MHFIFSLILIFASLWAVFFFAITQKIAVCVVIIICLIAAWLSPWSLLLGLPILLISIILCSATLRFKHLTQPIFKRLQHAMPSMSSTEREALDAGRSWWEKELFMGAPNWQLFAQYPYPHLSAEEQHFLDHEVESLCKMLDDWHIHQSHDLPAPVWQFIKTHGFLGLIIPKEYGGLEFSPFAQSRIMSKIASRSLTTAVTCMVPNSLGPGELLLHYGTEAQKQRYLPGLANGTEIPCFGLTSPEAGSDAGAIPDTGIVCYGIYQGQKILGLNMTFSKRWITLAPVATVIGLAFKLYDPSGLLDNSEKTDYGITCALIPANHKGVQIGPRHHPNAPFMNGTIEGQNVFIPLDWIIGGVKNAGQGWRMLMECLAVGRGISLPALATAAAEISYLNVGAYAKIREQFKLSIGKFEGVQEATAQIASETYTLEAFRYLVTCGLNQGGKPAVMTAMAKYYATESMRRIVNHAMDVVGGRAIQMGPRNFLALAYQAIPVSITVEGANILSRSLMIFGQGSMRCHPYLYQELQLLQQQDSIAAEKSFDQIFYQHLGYTCNRAVRAWTAVFTGGSSARPDFSDAFTTPYYRQINRLSSCFALTADLCLGLLAGDIKRKEMLSGRLADIHAQLFMASSILRYYQHGQKTKAEQCHAQYALDQALFLAQEAFFALYTNFPYRSAAWFAQHLCFPFGRPLKPVSDQQKRDLATLFLQQHAFRDSLKQHVFYSTEPDDVHGRVESTFQMLLEIEPLWQKFHKARHKAKFQSLDFN